MIRMFASGGAMALTFGLAACERRRDWARQLEADFQAYLTSSGHSLARPDLAFTALGAFKDDVKYPHEAGPYADSLLFEYGVYDWGKGPLFELSLTRQVIFAGGTPADADERIIQLRVSFLYDPARFRELQSMTQWEDELPSGVRMLDFIRSSPAYPVSIGQSHRSVEVHASAQ